MKLRIDSTLANMRLDIVVHQQLPHLSRSFVQKLIDEGKVTVNGRPERVSYRLRESDELAIDFDESKFKPQKINLPVLYEDDNIIVIDKPAGVLTHSKGAFNPEGTVATFIQDRLDDSFGPDDRAGIVHRLDRDTSGVIVCAKNKTAAVFIQRQFSARKVTKQYVAIVEGSPKEQSAILRWPIARNPKKPQLFRVDPNGKSAETKYTVTASSNEYAQLLLEPHTGRTHQLRVHCLHLGHPIVGDRLYGNPDKRLYLHAALLKLVLPDGEERTFTSKIPPEFAELMAS